MRQGEIDEIKYPEHDRFPIVIQGDWMTLSYEEAPDRATALLKAAQAWVKVHNEAQVDPETHVIIDPEGISGHGTPAIELKVLKPYWTLNPIFGPGARKWSPDQEEPLQIRDGYETDSTWTVPEEF